MCGSALIIWDVRTIIGKCSVSFQAPDRSGPVIWPIRTEEVRNKGVEPSVFTPKSSLVLNKISSHTHLASGYPKSSVWCGSRGISGTSAGPERLKMGYLPTTAIEEANRSFFGSVVSALLSGP